MWIIDKSFTKAPKSYILQSLLVFVSVAVILTFIEVLTHAAIVAALGVVVHAWSYQIVIFVLLCAVCLAIAGRLPRRYLRDLF